MFSKEERSTFKYWYAHRCAFVMTALNLHCFKFKYLFHDWEKPWLKLFLRDYRKVQKWHRLHNPHHIEYYIKHKKADWEAMVIDWECSRFTKASEQLNARQECERKILGFPEYGDVLRENIYPILDRLGL